MEAESGGRRGRAFEASSDRVPPPCFHTFLSTFSVFPLLLPLAGAFGTSGLPVGMK